MSTYYRRHLPHWQPGGKIFFVTFRLYGSLPTKVIERLKMERDEIRKRPMRPGESSAQKDLDDAKRVFALFEKVLDEAIHSSGSDSRCWLADARVAGMVRDAIRHRDENIFRLHRYVIMPNHVHLLIEPLPENEHADSSGQDRGGNDSSYRSLANILRGLKLYTARQANGILGRSGPFWQEESFDHWVRSD